MSTCLIIFYLLVSVIYADDVQVSIDRTHGTYNVTINERIWFRSSYTALFADNRWYRSDKGSLPLIDTMTRQGTDRYLGAWNETRLIYQLIRNSSMTNVTGSIRQWETKPAITFHFETGSQDLVGSLGVDSDQVRTMFPSFLFEEVTDDDHRGFLSYGGYMMGDVNKKAGRWGLDNQSINTGIAGGPLVVFDIDQRGHGDAIVISPFSQFMVTSLYLNQTTLTCGVMSSVSMIPANYSQSMILYYSSKGINDAMRGWGETMQTAYNRTKQYRQNDLTIQYLGYYTDNGGYYYYNTEPGMNYEETMVHVFKSIPLPIHYMQMDSWWYYKGVAGGVSEWTAMTDIFPDGLPVVYDRMNRIPIAAHNRYWAIDTVYSKKYAFVIDEHHQKALPLSNDTFWFDLFSDPVHQWGLILYEQDWLGQQTIDFTPLRTDIELGQRWLNSMGQAAERLGMNIQYCTSLSRHALQALENPRVTQARASSDYARHLESNEDQWNIGISSILTDALGIAPYKDVFWSQSVEPGSPYKGLPIEKLPDREILIATLSTGPVTPGDRVNLTEVTRIMRCCRQDGLILKPDRPATMIDTVISDWAHMGGKVPGELYSTQSRFDNETFSIVFASNMNRNYLVSPSMIDTNPGLVWFYDDPFNLKLFDDHHPLEILDTNCSSALICLWYISPVWHFNDKNKTAYALLGEWQKWTAVSHQRFVSFTRNRENTQLILTIEGVADELVPMYFYHSQKPSSVLVTCSISKASGQGQISIDPEGIHCIS